jgi:serine-type D-Ala-D-Ala carboxypeptidase/endopeptidase (penicillin-binding protein 4)
MKRSWLSAIPIALTTCACLTVPQHPIDRTGTLPPDRAARRMAGDLDAIFNDPLLARALVGVRVESLRDHRLLYERNSAKLVIPASNMKIVTLAVAAERLGWGFTYETRLEAAGPIENGVLRGDLVVVGTGDPSIVSLDFAPAALFAEWATALWDAGIRQVDGRVIGDDRAFDSDGLGPGWAFDYLAEGYAAPTGALSYNENEVVLRAWPGPSAGTPARIELTPPGHLLDVVNEIQTGAADARTVIDLFRFPGSSRLVVRGRVPASGAVVTRTTTVDNPTRFFAEGLRLAILDRGIQVVGGAWDADQMAGAIAGPDRRVITRRTSQPLSSLAGYFMKVSQNFYAETLLKTIGRAATPAEPGSVATGRRAVRETLTAWGVPEDAYEPHDGSGLSRYDYVTAGAIVTILRHVWDDERLRGPFVASLPVAGRDGTLASRMRNTVLDVNVQAKTGTISNVRSLSGYLETRSGEKIVFSMIVNHFTASSAQVDAIVERALARVYER